MPGPTNENDPSASFSHAINGAHSNNADITRVTEKPLPDSPSDVPPLMNIAILERLARQVEYYFSDVNLEKDAYVSTLRSLNDGYVPLSIISNFGKVRMLVPQDSFNSVRRAVTDCSDLLEIVHVDTQTGKRVDGGVAAASAETQTVEAVGPKAGEPIPISSIQTYPASSCAPRPIAGTPVQNTVILREVPEGIQDSHIRDLFSFGQCPPIQSLHLDVANCWFVTLKTASKEEMLNVMLELRSKKFHSGESVKARLKSAVVLNADVSPVPAPFTNAASNLYAPQLHGGNKKGGSKKKKNGTNKSKNSSNNAQSKAGKGAKVQHDGNSDSSSRNGNNGSSMEKPKSKKIASPRQESRSKPTRGSKQAPPTLGEDQFPALPTEDLMNKNMVEVEKLPEQGLEDDNRARKSSDSASTATTTSSSSSSKNTGSGQHSIGGYAAALLKPVPPVNTTAASESKPVPRAELHFGKKVEKTTREQNAVFSNERSIPTKSSKLNADEPVVKVQAPSWGGGRSFADVLRKEAATILAYKQSA